MKVNVSSTKLKGTVLFTVVSVLMVLIVFLMGTLALAATASNRAYSNYQKEQTEYTARAVLDSVIKAINEDTGATNGLKWQMAHNLQTTSSTPLRITVTGTDGLNADVTIRNVENRNVYSTTQLKWVSGTVYEVSTTIDKTMANTTYSAYIIDEKVAGGGGGGGGGGAFVATGTTEGKIGTSGLTTGGTEIGLENPPRSRDKWFEFDNTAYQSVPFYVNGSLNLKSQTTMYFNKAGKGQFVAVEGDLLLSNNFDFQTDPAFTWPAATLDYTDVPSLYVGGTLKQTASDNKFNTGKSVPVNVYCGNLETHTVNVMSFMGDLYAFDETATSIIQNQNKGTMLYEWAKATLNNSPRSALGNLYSAGNVQIAGPAVEGEVRVEKNLTVQGYVTDAAGNKNVFNDTEYVLNERVVCGGTLTVDGSDAMRYALRCKDNLYADAIVLNNCTLICEGAIDARDIQAIGPVTIKCDTVKCETYNTGIIFQKLDGTPNTPVATSKDSVAKKSGLDAEGIYPNMYTDNEVRKNIINVPTMTKYNTYPSTLLDLETNMTTPIDICDDSGVCTLPTHTRGEVKTSCKLTGNYNEHGDLIIDATRGNLVIYVNNFSMPNGRNIIIKGHSQVIFFIDGYFNIEGNLITEGIREYFRHHPGDKTYKQVQDSATSKLYPNVIVHSTAGSSFTVKNGAFLVTALFRAPNLDFEQTNAYEIPFDIPYVEPVPTGGETTTVFDHMNGNEKCIGVIGQLICHNIKVSNNWGMIYVTLPDGTAKCHCCAKCTGDPGCTCDANGCTCASCTCKGGGAGVKVPSKFVTMYYNIY
ncbi:MAG: DUF342 domain-containing protein [Ruminococcus sp.]|nr:DUF342 domain-containing protein [Ruminococcus sp.]